MTGLPLRDRRLPPVDLLGTLAMALVITGGIYLASVMPGGGSLVPGVLLLCAATVVLAIAVVMLVRIPDFAWGPFRTVAFWGLLAYLVVAGMIAFAFILDGTRGQSLLLTLLMLLAFAAVVPLLLAFGVARYQEQ
ncbi:MAG: hypothetical protein WCK40_10775 [Thermoleophilia bacterium]